MKAEGLKKYEKQAHLRVVKNSLKKISDTAEMYINTLTPDFSYTNHKGEIITNDSGVL